MKFLLACLFVCLSVCLFVRWRSTLYRTAQNAVLKRDGQNKSALLLFYNLFFLSLSVCVCVCSFLLLLLALGASPNFISFCYIFYRPCLLLLFAAYAGQVTMSKSVRVG